MTSNHHSGVGKQAWRPVILVLGATLLLLAGTVGAYLFLSRNKIPVTALVANSRIPAGYSFAVLTRFAVGDVFGDGHDALVVNMPEPTKPFEWPTEDSPGSFVTAVYRMRRGRLDEVYRSAPQVMPVSDLTLADTNGNGRREIWFGYFGDASQPAALEWEETGFSPVQAWASRPGQPVVVARVPGGEARPDVLLVLAEYQTPELAQRLTLVRHQDGGWEDDGALRPGQPYSPKDHLAVADVNGDGGPELLTVTGRMNLVVTPRPFAITGLAPESPVLTMEGVYPDDLEVADLDGNGLPEVYLSANLPLEVGKPYRGSVRGIEWNGREWVDVYYEEFERCWITDLTSGDLDGDGQPNLIIGTLRGTDATRFRFGLELRLFGGRQEGE